MRRPAAQFLKLLATLALALCLGAAASARAATPALRALEKEIRKVVDERASLAARIAQNSAGLDALARRIEEMKRDKQPGLLDKYRLEKMLAESLERSRELDEQEAHLRRLDERIHEMRGRIVAEADAEIRRIFEEMNEAGEKKNAPQLVMRYFQCRKIKDTYREDEPAGEMPAIIEFAEDELDTAGELIAKADLVRDFRAKVRAYAEYLEQRIDELEDELRLSDDMNNLIEQEILFNDGAILQPIVPSGGNAGSGEGTPVGDDDASEEGASLVSGGVAVSIIDAVAVESELKTDRMRIQSKQQLIAELKQKRETLDQIIEMLNKQERALRERAKRLMESGNP